jgi:hypothetical protein
MSNVTANVPGVIPWCPDPINVLKMRRRMPCAKAASDTTARLSSIFSILSKYRAQVGEIQQRGPDVPAELASSALC